MVLNSLIALICIGMVGWVEDLFFKRTHVYQSRYMEMTLNSIVVVLV